MPLDVSFVVLGMYTTKDADVYLRLMRQHGAVIIDDPAVRVCVCVCDLVLVHRARKTY